MTVRERPYTVAVLREFELVGWLRRHPVTLTAEQVQRLAALAEQPATWQRAPEIESVDDDAFERLRCDIERARWRRALWVTLGIAALPFAAIAAPTMFSATF